VVVHMRVWLTTKKKYSIFGKFTPWELPEGAWRIKGKEGKVKWTTKN